MKKIFLSLIVIGVSLFINANSVSAKTLDINDVVTEFNKIGSEKKLTATIDSTNNLLKIKSDGTDITDFSYTAESITFKNTHSIYYGGFEEITVEEGDPYTENSNISLSANYFTKAVLTLSGYSIAEVNFGINENADKEINISDVLKFSYKYSTGTYNPCRNAPIDSYCLQSIMNFTQQYLDEFLISLNTTNVPAILASNTAVSYDNSKLDNLNALSYFKEFIKSNDYNSIKTAYGNVEVKVDETIKRVEIYVGSELITYIDITDDFFEYDAKSIDVSKTSNLTGVEVALLAIAYAYNGMVADLNLSGLTLDTSKINTTYAEKGIEVIMDVASYEDNGTTSSISYAKYFKLSLDKDTFKSIYNEFGQKETDPVTPEDPTTPTTPTTPDSPISSEDTPIDNPNTGSLISYVVLIVGTFIGYKLFKTSKKNSKLRRI